MRFLRRTEQEILAVAYPGDTAESVIGLYQREAAAAGNELADGGTGSEEEEERRQGGGGLLAGLSASLGRRSGYGTIQDDDVESGLSDDEVEMRRKRGRRWWQVWRR
jgi:hypothetical protein